ncbi:glycerophosphodiester phosphodiesterase domain-containing protein 5 isoform X2 [Lampetra planeri]
MRTAKLASETRSRTAYSPLHDRAAMVKHQPLQYYRPQLCLSCLAGLYGCRWKRYQRSHDDSTKWERLWFLLVFLTCALSAIWFYFWCQASNDYNDFEWFLYSKLGYWYSWSVPMFVIAIALLTYLVMLLVLALCHVSVGLQMYMHWTHKVGVCTSLVFLVALIVAAYELWRDEWSTFVYSFQSTAPFLHIGAVVGLTLMAWLVAGQFARTDRLALQVSIVLVYLAALLTLYLLPLLVRSPCIVEERDLPARPKLFGHRGAPMLAPENTIMSFERATECSEGLETDVMLSLDGVPFLMHDTDLRRTTDALRVFGEPRASAHPSRFNMSELRSLNAGSWFLRSDPFGTAASLSPDDRALASNQSVGELSEVLHLAAQRNQSVIFDLRRPPWDHPYADTWLETTVQAVLASGMPHRLMMWLPDEKRDLVALDLAPGFRQTTGVKKELSYLHAHRIVTLNLHYSGISQPEISNYSEHNVTTNLYVVNSAWIYSMAWCAGARSVTTNDCGSLARLPQPVWRLNPGDYRLMWITTDVISATLVIAIFIVQRWRLGSMTVYNPEQIMLSTSVRKNSRDVKTMKEKLIFTVENGVMKSDACSLSSDSPTEEASSQPCSPPPAQHADSSPTGVKVEPDRLAARASDGAAVAAAPAAAAVVVVSAGSAGNSTFL